LGGVVHKSTAVEVEECVTLKIPVQNIPRMMTVLNFKTHPTDDDQDTIRIANELWDSDEVFRNLYNQLRGYIWMHKR
jgi:hypothetical protein